MNSQLCLRPPFFSRVLSNYNWHPSPTGIFLDLLYLNVQERARVVKKVTICFFSRDSMGFFFFFNFIYLFIYFIFFDCVGSSFLCEDFLSLWQAGATLQSRCAGLSLSRPLLLRGPLTVAASLVAEHRLQKRRLSSCGSRA